MRLVLVCIAAVVSAACVIAFHQSGRITQAHDNYVSQSVPLLVLAQQAERDLKGLIMLLQRASSVSDETTFKETLKDFNTHVEGLRIAFQDIETVKKNAPAMSGLGENLDDISREINALEINQGKIFAVRKQLKILDEKITSLNSQSQEILRFLSLSTTIEIEELLRDTRKNSTEKNAAIEQLFSDVFLESLNLANIARDIESVVDLATLSDISGPKFTQIASAQDISDVQAKVNRKFIRIMGLIAQLHPTDARTELATLVGAMRDATAGPEGIFELGKQQLDALLVLEYQRASGASVVADISTQFADLTASIHARVAHSTENLNDAAHRLNLIVGAVFILAVLVILVGNSVVVEKQISHRMARLATAVKAIAKGDLTHEIDVSGHDELGDIARALAIFKRNAEELRRSNIDLEKFAYVAAHDLRSPLRAIHDLAEWTLEDTDNSLSQDSKEYLELLQQRTSRLNLLLADLLDYARAGQEGAKPSPVHLDAMVDQVVSILGPQKGFEITFDGPLEPVMTLATPLRQILLNLISNAIKHHDRATGTISVKARIQNNRLHVAILDDGPGIPTAYQEKVFSLFQTLKPRDEVEGSGLGLAIIRKLVDRYSGTIDLVSNPSERRGSCFRFDLPLSEFLSTESDQAKAA